MADMGVMVFLIGALGLMAVSAPNILFGFRIPKFEEAVMVLATMAMIGSLVMVRTVYDVAAFLTLAGGIGLMVMMFVNFPKRLTEAATVLTVGGAIAMVMMGMVPI